jgi:protoheme IX farnesyltransferase
VAPVLFTPSQYDRFRVYARLRLAKVGLCLFIGSATFFGAILADPVVSLRLAAVAGAVFLVAAGAASLNSLQEQQLDGEMARTRDRPMPTGMLTPRQAGSQAIILLTTGLLVLVAATNEVLPAALTGIAVVLYNGVYTPLKKKTILAIVPGAICGALPAYIGWLAGGGGEAAFPAILLFALFVLWQVPHFWLVLLIYREDYAAASLPNLLKEVQEDSLRRFFIPWIGALASMMLMFATLPYPLPLAARGALIVNALLLPTVFFCRLRSSKTSNYRLLFMVLNGALLLHMVILGAGRVLGAKGL